MKKLLNIISSLLLVVLVALAAAIAGPLAFGYKEMSVLSGSMEPQIHVGSLVYVKPGVDPAQLETGDIVTYYMSDDVFVTHRVVSVNTSEQTLITKGDANEVEDGEISFSKVYGKVDFHIPYIGFLSVWIHKPIGIMAVTGLVVLVILINFLPYLLTPEKKKEDQEKISEESETK